MHAPFTQTRQLRYLALANGEATDGAITCRRIAVRIPKEKMRGTAGRRYRFMFKLNGNVITEAQAARWLDPNNANF